MMRLFRTLPFALYFIGLMYPIFKLQTYWDQFSDEYAQAGKIGQGLALAFMGVMILMMLRRRFYRIHPPAVMYTIPFVIWATLSLFWSIEPSQTGLSLILLIVYGTFCTMFWAQPTIDLYRMSRTGIFGIYLGFAALAAVLPIQDRTLGYAPPNLLAHYAMCGLFLTMLSGKNKIPMAVVTVAIVIATQARTVAIELLLFGTLYYMHDLIIRRMRSPAMLAVFVVGVTGIGYLLYSVALGAVIGAVSSATGVTTGSRLGSDFTGRGEIWEQGLKLIEASPYVGYGFRTRGTANLEYITDTLNAHSGLLNTILDNGFIGLALFVFAYGHALLAAFSPVNDAAVEYRRIVASLLIANVSVYLIEPNYISFAHPTSLMTILCVTFSFVDFRRARRKRKPVEHFYLSSRQYPSYSSRFPRIN